jgi:hypothetical protein
VYAAFMPSGYRRGTVRQLLAGSKVMPLLHHWRAGPRRGDRGGGDVPAGFYESTIISKPP